MKASRITKWLAVALMTASLSGCIFVHDHHHHPPFFNH
jgi:hypothetical protein